MTIRVLIVDNLDSFTHNLAQAMGGAGAQVLVARNDLDAEEVPTLRCHRIVFSPGPGGPGEAGHCLEVLRLMAGEVPMLGVCLGMQLMAHAYGARVVRAAEPMHGRASALAHDALGLFEGLPQGIPVGRYHSLKVDAATLPSSLRVTAWSDGVAMGLQHRQLALAGIQFHPESVLTPHGVALLRRFVEHGLPSN